MCLCRVTSRLPLPHSNPPPPLPLGGRHLPTAATAFLRAAPALAQPTEPISQGNKAPLHGARARTGAGPAPHPCRRAQGPGARTGLQLALRARPRAGWLPGEVEAGGCSHGDRHLPASINAKLAARSLHKERRPKFSSGCACRREPAQTPASSPGLYPVGAAACRGTGEIGRAHV